MPKYTRQHDQFNCGPVALLNALKWAGYPYTLKDLPRLSRLCKCKPGDLGGTLTCDFDRALRRYKRLIVLPDDGPFERPYISMIDEHLDLGGVVVFSYIYKYHGRVEVSHLTLCIGREGKHYIFANDGQHKLLARRRRKTVVNMLRFSDPLCGCCDVWFLFQAA